MSKFIVQVTRWEPWIGEIEVDATSKTAAMIIAKQIAKAQEPDASRSDFEYDTTLPPKVTIDDVILCVGETA